MLNARKVALALGSTVALIHVAWSLIVAIGLGQSLVTFVHTIHFVEPIVVITPFNLGVAILLVVLAGIAGSIIGYLFATVWNLIHKNK